MIVCYLILIRSLMCSKEHDAYWLLRRSLTDKRTLSPLEHGRWGGSHLCKHYSGNASVCQSPAIKLVETQGAAVDLNDAPRSQLGSNDLILVLRETSGAPVLLRTLL